MLAGKGIVRAGYGTKGKGIVTHIYRNDLGKACLQHDMVATKIWSKEENLIKS